METFQWLTFGAGVLSGGAGGAIITQAVTIYRARRQPIRYQLRTTPIFEGQRRGNGPVTRLVVDYQGERHEYSNLHAVELVIENAGNQDFEKFTFGVTQPEAHSTVMIDTTPPDRHHSVQMLGNIENGALPAEIDFSLEPFNRGDRYSIIFQVSLIGEDPIESPMKLTSPHPITFARVVERGDTAALARVLFEAASPTSAAVLKAFGR